MRILLVANYLPPYAGGIQFVVDRLARGYAGRGHEVVVSGYDALRGRAELPYPTAAIPAWNPLERLSIPMPLFEPVTLRRRTAALVSWADAVHVHGLAYPNTTLALRLATQAGRPVVATEHVGTVATGRRAVDHGQAVAFRRARRWLAAGRGTVVVLNERVEAEMTALLGGSDRLVRIDNGVDTELFRPASAAGRTAARQRWGFDRPTALFVGRLSRKKGIDLLLDVANRTSRARGVQFAVAGKDTEKLRDVPANVRVLGLLDQPALASLYQAADLLVLPSDGEGFPLVVQEAMASGLPVVVTDGAVPRTGPHTSVVRSVPRTAAALAKEIHTMLDGDAAGREQLGAASREVALTHFDWATTVDRYLGLFERHEAGLR